MDNWRADPAEPFDDPNSDATLYTGGHLTNISATEGLGFMGGWI